MDKCYLCGKDFNETNIKKHDEHIIQQAIGGNLTQHDILCSKCGGKLGKEIDEPFSKIFDGIATRLDIRKDRKGNNKSSSTNGKYVNLKYKFSLLNWRTKSQKMNLLDFQYQYNQFCNEIGEIDVIWKDFKVYPLKPFHKYIENNTKVIIYGNRKNAMKYKKKVENEITKKFKDDKKPQIIICDDLDGIVEYPFNMDNQSFKRGLAKIAIGFASKHGIKREKLPLVLDIKNNKINNKIPTIQFYPLGILDRLIEIQKNEFDHYPFHNLILFTLDYDPKIADGKKVLICYIELFSTFQWYVILNEEYYGKSIYEYYVQNILKKDDYIVKLGRRYYKERNLWLQLLGITEEYIDKKFNERTDKNKSRWDIEEELIQEETIKQKYKFNFEEYLYRIINGISNQVMLAKRKKQFIKHELKDTYFGNFFNNKYLMNEYKKFEDFKNMIKFKQNLDLFFSQKFNEESNEYDEIFSIYSYRRFFYDDNLKNYYTEILEKYQVLEKSGAFKAYGYNKMHMLNNYIQIENIKHKTQQNLAPNR